MNLLYRPKFRNQYKKLQPALAKIVKEKMNLFSINPQDPKLKLHKLTGKWKGFYSLSITHSYRVILEFTADMAEARFHSIGTHDIYN